MVVRRSKLLLLPVLLLVLIPCVISAQESFEGLATVGGFGRFPSGLFGASNLVPANTLVTVRNLDTGRSERIIITDRGREIAELVPLSPARKRMNALREAGRVSWNGDKPKGLKGHSVRGAPVSRTVLENRR